MVVHTQDIDIYIFSFAIQGERVYDSFAYIFFVEVYNYEKNNWFDCYDVDFNDCGRV